MDHFDGDQAEPLADDLRALAHEAGVATEHVDVHGIRHETAAATVRAVLAAMDISAESPEQIAAARAELTDAPWRRTLPPIVVAREHAHTTVAVHVPHGRQVELQVELEGGGTLPAEQIDDWTPPRQVGGTAVGQASFTLPDLEPGWHTLVALEPSGTEIARTPLALTPDRLPLPDLDPDRGSRVWGLMAQLYSVRSSRSWGYGDLADLAELASIGADVGADFLLTNPLNAAEPIPPITPSPYLPTTRRFLDPLYIRPEDVREVGYLPTAQRTLLEWSTESVHPMNTDPGPIDRDAVWEAKRPALETIFAAGRTRARQRSFERFRTEHGQALADFALWCAAREAYAARPWPPDVAAARPSALADLRAELAERIDFHCWLQWVADEQLARAQATATASGMRIGLMTDLPVGVHPEGADAWSLQDVCARDMAVGAPPDMYNQQGQSWSQPPLRPDALERTGYAAVRDMVRAAVRHCGALRVDHILGFFRLWWIPAGAAPGEGTYVHYDHEAMIGILALEAYRAGAMVIGEDLGTVEPWMREQLADRGILGSSILWFEQDERGPRPPEQLRRLQLATVTTHDLPPTTGYLAEEHVDLRERLGLLTEPAEQVRLQARTERERMLAALRQRGLLPPDPSERQVVEALHRYLVLSPSVLIGVALTDAVGERRAQNQPGTDTEYPNWKVPLADGSETCVLIEDLPGNARFASLAAALERDLRRQS